MTVKNAKIKKESEVAKKPKADFELSAGALVFRRTNQGIVWLVLHYTAGHWDFPKGHVEKGETMIDAARREVLEEAGIKDLKFYPEFKRPLQYFFNAAKYSGSSTKQMVFKKVVFHLAETKEEEIKTIEKQIDDYISLIPLTKSESVKERYEQKVETLDKMAKDLKSGAKNKKEPNFEEALNLTLKFLGTPAETWKKADRNLKNMVHNMIFQENPGYCAETGFGTPKLSLPFSIKYYIVGKKSDLVVRFERSSNFF